MKISFTIPGNPQAQKRHRSRIAGGADHHFIQNYDPSKSSKKDFIAICLSFAPKTLLKGPLALHVTFALDRPLSHYKGGKRTNALKKNAPYFVTKKPDLDNLLKFVKDALKGIYYHDDSQIVLYENPRKIYSMEPHTFIMLSEISDSK